MSRPLAGRLRDRVRSRPAGTEHGVVRLIRALLLFEAVLYSVLTPILPHYAHVLHAGKPGIGLLAAAYPAGLVPGSLLGGWLAVRTGVRRTTLIGLLVFGLSVAAFGFGTAIVTLDALRFVAGVACGGIWGGGLTWVIAVAPRDRRGEVLGHAIGAAIFGTLLGPLLGTLTVAVGTRVVFCALGATALGLAAWTARHPEPHQAEREAGTPARTFLRRPRTVLGFWLILLEACTIGGASTLISLRLAGFGASTLLIGITFLLSSLLSAFVAPGIGRLVDRRGPDLPLTIGLASTILLLVALTLPHTVLPLAGLTVIALGPPLTSYTIPAMSAITVAADRAGIAMAMATMLLNLAWATGETVGAPAATNLAQVTSDAVPLLALAAIILLTLVVIRRFPLGRREAAAGAGGGPDAHPERERLAA